MLFLVNPQAYEMAEPCSYTCCYDGGCLKQGEQVAQ